MEDTKLYDTQHMERLKQKIAVYRETLTTLKKGISIEDFRNKKEEFDGFKIQIAHLDGLTKSIDEKQGTQVEGYEEKVNQIANQIDLLNQTVEAMNQEISLILKNEFKVETDELPEININKAKENISLHDSDQDLEIPEEIPQVKEPFLLTNNQPSYMQLQKLAGLALNTKQNAIIEKPVYSNPTTQKPPEERHFNHQYFQSISTHPSHMYNGLYKNITNTSSFHFKNESSVQEIPIYNNEPTINPSLDSAGEVGYSSVDHVDSIATTAEEIIDSAIPIVEDFKSIDSTVQEIAETGVPIVENIESTTEKVNQTIVPVQDDIESIDSIVEEIDHSAEPILDGVDSIVTAAEVIDEVPFECTIEALNVQADSFEINDIQEEPLNEAVPEEHKKEGFSSFFNLFRRRN